LSETVCNSFCLRFVGDLIADLLAGRRQIQQKKLQTKKSVDLVAGLSKMWSKIWF